MPNSILVQDIVAHIQNPKPHIKIVASLPNSQEVFLLNTINQLVFSNLDSRLAWAILNSTLINWYVYKFIFSNSIRTMHLNSQATDKIPIPKLTAKNKPLVDKIIACVDKILAIKSSLQDSESTEAIHSTPSLRENPQDSRGNLKSKSICHTERSEVSKNKSVDLEKSLDSSVASLPRNDKNKCNDEVAKLESQINDLVYKLYNLDSAEIQIVQGK